MADWKAFQVKVLPDEWEQIARLAEMHGCSMGEMVRIALSLPRERDAELASEQRAIVHRRRTGLRLVGAPEPEHQATPRGAA